MQVDCWCVLSTTSPGAPRCRRCCAVSCSTLLSSIAAQMLTCICSRLTRQHAQDPPAPCGTTRNLPRSSMDGSRFFMSGRCYRTQVLLPILWPANIASQTARAALPAAFSGTALGQRLTTGIMRGSWLCVDPWPTVPVQGAVPSAMVRAPGCSLACWCRTTSFLVAVLLVVRATGQDQLAYGCLRPPPWHCQVAAFLLVFGHLWHGLAEVHGTQLAHNFTMHPCRALSWQQHTMVPHSSTGQGLLHMTHHAALLNKTFPTSDLHACPL